MTLTDAQIQATLAQLQTLRKDITSLLAAARMDRTAQGVWIEATSMTSDETRVAQTQTALIAQAKADPLQ